MRNTMNMWQTFTHRLYVGLGIVLVRLIPPFCFPCCSLQLTITTTLFPVMFMLKMHASRLQKEVGNYIKAVRGW